MGVRMARNRREEWFEVKLEIFVKLR